MRQASVIFDDWLVCMVSSQLNQTELDLERLIGHLKQISSPVA
jgi:hypothetical protein